MFWSYRNSNFFQKHAWSEHWHLHPEIMLSRNGDEITYNRPKKIAEKQSYIVIGARNLSSQRGFRMESRPARLYLLVSRCVCWIKQMNKNKSKRFNGTFICCRALIGTIFIIMILSTFYDVIRTKQDSKRCTSNKKCRLKLRKNHLVFSFFAGDKMQILIAFSVYTNGKKMFACKRSKSEYSMECLNGIRVFSALWVIYAHAAVMTMMAPVFNFAYIPEVKWLQFDKMK